LAIYSWTLQVYDGSSFIETYKIPNPGNRGVTVGATSNQKVIQLWDGSRVFVSPQTKSSNDVFDFEITEASSTQALYLKLKDYVSNQRRIVMTTHTGEKFTGYFTSVKKSYTLSGKDQKYTITISFTPED